MAVNGQSLDTAGRSGELSCMVGLSAQKRVGWLLRANRRLGPVREFRTGREFARCFRPDRTDPLAPSHVTRWETGQLRADRAVVARYESLLGLPDHYLTAVCDAVLRFSCDRPGARYLSPPPDPLRDPDAAERADQRLHELLYRAEQPGTMAGGDWSELASAVHGRPDLFLHPPGLWRTLAQHLLTELIDAEDLAWLTRQEALSKLLEHPRACRYVVQACIETAEDPDTPAFIEPISLLDVTPHAAANRYVLDQVHRPNNERSLQGALMAATRKVRAGHFRSAEEWSCLIGAVHEALNQSVRHPAVAPLAMDLGRTLVRRTPLASVLRRDLNEGPEAWRAQPHRRGATGEVEAVCERLAVDTIARLPDELGDRDDVLPLLIEEMLFSPNFDERLYSTMLVSATPYREPLAQALMRMATGLLRRDEALASAVLRCLTMLNTTAHRHLVYRTLTDPRASLSVSHAAAWATPHCAGPQEEAAWRRMLDVQFARWQASPTQLGAEILHGLTYGIGTDGHSALLDEIRANPRMPQMARVMAAWWLTNLRRNRRALA
jgi:hypothetical protein